jgi:hypothetical protein
MAAFDFVQTLVIIRRRLVVPCGDQGQHLDALRA